MINDPGQTSHCDVKVCAPATEHRSPQKGTGNDGCARGCSFGLGCQPLFEDLLSFFGAGHLGRPAKPLSTRRPTHAECPSARHRVAVSGFQVDSVHSMAVWALIIDLGCLAAVIEADSQ